MKSRSYNRELQISQAMVSDVFNNIVIDRRDGNGCVEKEFLVACVFGDRSNTLKQLESRQGVIKLPLISIVRGGISKDSSRVHSINESISKNAEGLFNIKSIVGMPLNIGYNMQIVTKYQEDMDQILSNFMPFFNPAIYISWKLPSGNGKVKCALIWDGNADTTYLKDDETKTPRIVTSLSFTLRTWMFPGMWSKYNCDTEEDELDPFDQPSIYHINMFVNADDQNNSVIEGKYTPSAGFYAVPSEVECDEFVENVAEGLVDPKYHDSFKLSTANEFQGYFDKFHANIGGDQYNPDDKIDLQYMVDHIEDAGAFLTDPEGNAITLRSYESVAIIKAYWEDNLLSNADVVEYD